MVTVDHWFGPLLIGESPPPTDGRPTLAAPSIGHPTRGPQGPLFQPKTSPREEEKKKKKKEEKKKKKKRRRRKRKEKEKKKKKKKEKRKEKGKKKRKKKNKIMII